MLKKSARSTDLGVLPSRISNEYTNVVRLCGRGFFFRGVHGRGTVRAKATASVHGSPLKRTLTLLLKIRGIRPIRVIRVEKTVRSMNLGVGIMGIKFGIQSDVISTIFQTFSVLICLMLLSASHFPAHQWGR